MLSEVAIENEQDFASSQASRLRDLYPFAIIRGSRTTRMNETPLGAFQLNYETAALLGDDNVGVFVGGCPCYSWIHERLEMLRNTSYPAKWIVMAATDRMALGIFNGQRVNQCSRVHKTAPRWWECGNIAYTTPEGLESYSRERPRSHSIAGLLLVDLECIVHKTRGSEGRGPYANDRPQYIAKFRADHAVAGRQPPFLLITTKLAKSLETQKMASRYCLNAWWFVDGFTLRVGRFPAVRQEQP